MENKIIDVTFTELPEDIETKTLEELKTEANSIYMQMEMIGNIGVMMAARAGKVLTVIKEKVPYGEWGDWCKGNLSFSKRKAENMMRLAEKMDDENSLFSKTQIFAEVGISKVWELLAAPEEVAKEVIETAEVEEISVAELKEEIRKTKDAYEALEYQNEIQVKTLEENIESLKGDLAKASESDTTGLEEKLEKAKADLKKVKEANKEELQREKQKIEADKEKELQEAVEKAKAEALKEAEEKGKDIIQRAASLNAENEKLKRLIENSSNEDLIALKVNSENIQKSFNACLGNLDKLQEQDKEKAEKMKGYLRAIVASMAEELG